jgi:TM2 domain-containing membrane protein YozV
MKKLLLLSVFALTLLTQTLFSQGTLQSDADLSIELYESGQLTHRRTPFRGEKEVAIVSSIIIPGTGQFINGQFIKGTIFLGVAATGFAVASQGWIFGVIGGGVYLATIIVSAIDAAKVADRNVRNFNLAKSKMAGVTISPTLNFQNIGHTSMTPTFGFALSF